MSSQHDQAVLQSIFNPYFPLGENFEVQPVTENEIEKNEDDKENKEAEGLEVKGVLKAEEGDVEAAIMLLTRALELAPASASAHNNRAQAYRLLNDDNAALEDLDAALALSKGQGRVGIQALCQRAMLYRRRGDEQSCHKDLQAAAALGSEFAKQQLVQMNPYAAMCNQMLKQSFGQL